MRVIHTCIHNYSHSFSNRINTHTYVRTHVCTHANTYTCTQNKYIHTQSNTQSRIAVQLQCQSCQKYEVTIAQAVCGFLWRCLAVLTYVKLALWLNAYYSGSLGIKFTNRVDLSIRCISKAICCNCLLTISAKCNNIKHNVNKLPFISHYIVDRFVEGIFI